MCRVNTIVADRFPYERVGFHRSVQWRVSVDQVPSDSSCTVFICNTALTSRSDTSHYGMILLAESIFPYSVAGSLHVSMVLAWSHRAAAPQPVARKLGDGDEALQTVRWAPVQIDLGIRVW